ncbi:MAG: hypothetical protein M1382_01205 [Candidatus Marsarchaeota archaeon]|jgi:hypothetical protein|nr:hypothetical protein [Candidatus Marsarchaeota archaeon]
MSTQTTKKAETANKTFMKYGKAGDKRRKTEAEWKKELAEWEKADAEWDKALAEWWKESQVKTTLPARRK